VLLAFLAYLVGTSMMLGTQGCRGQPAAAFGLWWLLLPMLALGIWLYARDGRV
jgi:lipopolysaccharide export system permease protein